MLVTLSVEDADNHGAFGVRQAVRGCASVADADTISVRSTSSSCRRAAAPGVRRLRDNSNLNNTNTADTSSLVTPGLNKWKGSMNGKTTLIWYAYMNVPRFEMFYDGSFGSLLLFAVRYEGLASPASGMNGQSRAIATVAGDLHEYSEYSRCRAWLISTATTTSNVQPALQPAPEPFLAHTNAEPTHNAAAHNPLLSLLHRHSSHQPRHPR
ncbi:hypothetical protein FHG87_022190 [Trinorchestia longiramus]|nr:hypothetical protein FHG87_022190 [Trinorchestia longiramus]